MHNILSSVSDEMKSYTILKRNYYKLKILEKDPGEVAYSHTIDKKELVIVTQDFESDSEPNKRIPLTKGMVGQVMRVHKY